LAINQVKFRTQTLQTAPIRNFSIFPFQLILIKEEPFPFFLLALASLAYLNREINRLAMLTEAYNKLFISNNSNNNSKACRENNKL